MSNLLASNVFIDTEVFVAAKLNLESIAFQTLLGHSKSGRVKLFSTTVTVGEIKTRIALQVGTATAGLRKLKTEWLFLHNLPSHDLKVIFSKVDKAQLIEATKDEFDTYIKNARAVVLDLEGADADSVFKKYFDTSPPFSEGKKKSEFPDAFAISDLEQWCEDNDQKMYIVSNDLDWAKACATSNWLIHLDMLDKFLDLVAKDVEEPYEKAKILFKSNEWRIIQGIATEFPERSFYLDDEDGEVSEVTVDKVTLIEEPLLLTLAGSEADFSVKARIEFAADVTVNDMNSGYYDEEDARWIVLPKHSGRVHRSEEVQVGITLLLDEETGELDDIVCSVEADATIRVPRVEWEHWPSDMDDDRDME